MRLFGYNELLDATFKANGCSVLDEATRFLRGYRTILVPASKKDKFKAPFVLEFTNDATEKTAS